MDSKTDSTKTINESHFGVKAHEDLGSSRELRSLWIEIPDYCHLQCDYCFASTRRGHPHHSVGQIDDQQYLKLLDDFRASGGLYLGIPGNGEPFHPHNRPLVMRILHHATDLGLSTTVFTTGDSIFFGLNGGDYGTSVNGEPDFSLARELLTLNVILLLKYNSARPEVQDLLVKQKGYTEARSRAMNWLIELGFSSDHRLGIVTSILPENKNEIVDLYHYADRNKLIFDCDTILPRGRGAEWKKHHDTISQTEYREIYERLSHASGGKMASGGSYIGVACDRVRHHLYVDIKGDVFPCIGCVGEDRKLKIGNIRETSLNNLWGHWLRAKLRENLKGVMKGPCARCENFEKSCWSCLGRMVKQMVIADDDITMLTRGCFNHRPRLSQWMAICNREIRRLILRVSLPGYDGLRKEFLSLLSTRGMEALWSRNHQVAEGVACDTEFHKDMNLSAIHMTGGEVWNGIVDESLDAAQNPCNVKEDDRHHLNRLQGILPSFLIPTIKVLTDRYDQSSKTLGSDKRGRMGLLQFCLFMFYMPDKKRYFYRSVALNQLDSGAEDVGSEKIPSGDAKIDVPDADSNRILNNRRVRLVQRWAEALQEGEQAPILPHIRNLSHEMEADNVQTYELVLCSKLFSRDLVEIDREQRFYPHSRILGIGALLDIPVIADRVAKLAGTVDQMVLDDDQWGSLDDVLSGKVFTWQKEPQVDSLRSVYARMADTAFIDPASMSLPEQDEVFAQVREAVLDVLKSNVWLFPDGSEKGWFSKNLRNKLDTMDLTELFSMVVGDRRNNILHGNLPLVFDPGADLDRRKRIGHRLYSRLLVEFLRLFFDEKGGRHAEWIKAVNYFIWLGYFRDILGICDYFVLHAPNLQQQCSVLFEGSVPPLPASGMILSSSERLPFSMREECEELFRTIVSPVEELSFAHWGAEPAGRKDGETKTRRHFTHELNTPLAAIQREYDCLSHAGKLSLDYITLWHRFASRSIDKYDIPVSISQLFDSDEDFLRFVVSLSLMRVGQEGKVPSYSSGGEFVSLTSEDLMSSKHEWMETCDVAFKEIFDWITVNMPPNAVQPCKRTVQTLILSLSIGAFHHLIEFVFASVRLLNQSANQVFANCRKGRFRIVPLIDGRRLRILIQNTGGEPPMPSGHGLSDNTFGSNFIGRSEWNPAGCSVLMEPFISIGSIGQGAEMWQAEIVVAQEMHNGNNTRAI